MLMILQSCKQALIEVSSVWLNTSTVEMVEGDTYSLVATIMPENAEYDAITWASSNTNVAIVNQGTVTALKEGESIITARAGGQSATCSVTVSAKFIAVTSIALDKNQISLYVNDSETITAIVNPSNATDQTVRWSSSDSSVASVKDGIVTAHKIGTATITAKAGDMTATCVITVVVTPVSSITLDQTCVSLKVNETVTLFATVCPDDATDKTVTWSTSDSSIANVKDGVVMAKNIGTATIIAKAGDMTATCTVQVVPDSGSGGNEDVGYVDWKL